MVLAFLLGLALGIMLTVGSVKMGISAARYIWKHAFALIVIGAIIAWVMITGEPIVPPP